ncbi:MAG: site-specific integrase [Oscillospiraceae bacterium]|nr:site-specific integrase [Oscillospiraceae bacterium]
MPIYKVDGVKKDGLQKYLVRVNYTSDSGQAKQLTRTAYGSEVAKDLERKLEDQAKNKELEPGRKLTVQQLFDEYEAVKKFEIRESSLDKEKRNYGMYVQPTMAEVRIDKLTSPVLQQWKLSVEEKGLALKTRQHAYGIFRAILNYAVKMEYIKKNPLLAVGTFKDALYTKPEMKIYTAEQFLKYITAARCMAEERQEKHNDLSWWGFYVFFNIAFYTGLRKGEIHALKWSDLDGSLLHVRRSILQKLKGGDRETPPKNKSSIRTLQMPLPLIQVLDEHRARQKQLTYFSDDYRICGGERCLRDSTISNRNKRYAEFAGLDRIRIHDFRHSHVSLLANESINIQEIARRLGHSKIEETWNTYSHLYPREEEKAVEILNRVA